MHYVSATLIGINRGYDKRYNASAVTHELPEETKSAIHNRRVKSLTLQPGDRRLIIKTRWPALSSAFFRLRVTPVTSARRYRASSVINVKTVFAVVLRSRVSVLFLPVACFSPSSSAFARGAREKAGSAEKSRQSP